MELTQIRSENSFFPRTQNLQGSREETLEMIVPDACPDIARILDSCGQCRLTRREITDSGLVLAGTVQVITLYLPEGEEGVRRLEAEIPFQHVYECQQSEQDCRLLARAWVSMSETRVINPRKVLLRVNLTEQAQIFCRRSMSLCGGLEAQPELGLQQQVQHFQTTHAVQISEKEFTLNDELSFNPGRRGATEVLRMLPAVQYSEARLIGSKLVIKGSVSANLLLRGEEGQLYTTEAELPFSQMVDAGDTGTEAAFDLSLAVTGSSCGQLSADGRTIPVTFDLTANAVFYETVPLELLTDAFSVSYPLELQQETVSVCQTTEESGREPVRELVEVNEPVRNICAYHAEPGAAGVSREQDQLKISLPISVSVVYQTESGSCASVQHAFSVEKQFRMPEDGGYSLRFALSQMEALTAASGIELRGSVEFFLRTHEEQQISAVSSATLDQEAPCQRDGQPSVMLFRPTGDETLWDIAKRYQTTCQDICKANGLTEEQHLNGQMLLIPKAR